MSNQKTNKLSTLNIAAMLSVFLFAGAGTYENAAIQTMIEAWPDVSTATIRLVVSLPTLFSLPFMLIIGVLAGKKLSYKFCALAGTAMIAAGGVIPFFVTSSWTLVLVCRCVLGIGAGFLGMRNPLIVKSVSGAEQAKYIGWATTLYSLGGFIAGPVVGVLCTYGWNYSFLFNGLAFLPLILQVLFLKEPPKEEESVEKAAEAAAPKEKVSVDWRIIYYVIIMAVSTMILYPMLSGLATFMGDKGIGNSVLAGTALSAYSIAGVIANMFLGTVTKVCRKYTIAAMCALIAIGQAVLLFVPSVATVFIGVVLAGAGFGIMMSILQVYNGKVAHPAIMGTCSTVIIAMIQLGVFLHGYFITACDAIFHSSTDVESAYLGCVIISVVLTILSAVLKVWPDDEA